MDLKITPSGQTIVKPTALGPGANTDTKLLIYGLFQKGRVLAQDVESFNGKLRDELLNGEIFNTLKEAKVVIERWRQEFNRLRPHSSLGYRPPAPLHSAGFNQPLSAPND